MLAKYFIYLVFDHHTPYGHNDLSFLWMVKLAIRGVLQIVHGHTSGKAPGWALNPDLSAVTLPFMPRLCGTGGSSLYFPHRLVSPGTDGAVFWGESNTSVVFFLEKTKHLDTTRLPQPCGQSLSRRYFWLHFSNMIQTRAVIRQNASLWLLPAFLKYPPRTSPTVEGAQKKLFMEHIFKLANKLGITWQRRQYTHVWTTKPFPVLTQPQSCVLRPAHVAGNYMVPEDTQQSNEKLFVKTIRSQDM